MLSSSFRSWPFSRSFPARRSKALGWAPQVLPQPLQPARSPPPHTSHCWSKRGTHGDPPNAPQSISPPLDLLLPGAPTCRVPDLNLRGRAAQGDGDLLQAGVERDGPRVLPAVLVVRRQQVDFGGLDGLFHPLQYLGAGGGGLTWISPSPYGIAISGLFQKQGCIAGAQNLRHTPPDARGTEQFL